MSAGPRQRVDDEPMASVIIPHLDTPALLTRCLESVLAQRLARGGFEVIVVDNGSRTPLDEVRAAFPTVRFLAEPRPGPGLARNTGAAAARAPVLAFIDADCRAAPGWLQAACDAIARDPQRAVAGGDVRIDVVDPRRLTGVEAYESVFGYRQQYYIGSLDFSVTANLAMAAPVLAAVGPFAGIELAEDRDWGRRAAAAGYAIRYVPEMLVYHPARADFVQLTRKWRRHVTHDRHGHDSAGRAAWRWYALAAGVWLSGFYHSTRMFTSKRLSGLGNRCRGLIILFRIRAWRAAEMLRIAGGRGAGAAAWRQT